MKRRVWLLAVGAVAFLVCSTLGWILATPFGGFPDELDHYLRSASVAEGSFVGDENPHLATTVEPDRKSCCEPDNPTAQFWVQSGVRLVDIPPGLDPSRLPCTVSLDHPRTDCAVEATRGAPPFVTAMGTIEPVGYVAPGVALAVVGDDSLGFRAVRLANALLGILAVGLVLAGTARGPNLPSRLVGLCLATTPMVVFILSSGSPSALEVAGALGTWLALLEITSDRGGSPAALWWGLTLSAALLASARSIGPIWLVLIAAVVVVLRGWPVVRGAVAGQRRRAVACGGVVAAACLLTVGWEVVIQPSVGFDAGFAIDQLWPAMADSPRVLSETIGAFGSLDIPLPDALVALWQLIVLLLAGLALWKGTQRSRLAVLLVGALTIAAIVLIGAGVLRQNGFALQGRHVMPIVIGLPLVAAEAVRGRDLDLRWFAALAGTACAAIQLYSWAFAARSFGRTAGGLVVVPAFDGPWSGARATTGGVIIAVGCLCLAAVTVAGSWVGGRRRP